MGVRGVRLFALAVAGVVVLGLAGCGSAREAEMPDVVGKQLDVALSDIERAGFGGDVEVLGGGMFGVVDKTNWQVCGQLPTAGETISDAPRLEVDRSCGGEAAEKSQETEGEAPEKESAAPEETAPASSVDAKAIEQKFEEHLHNNFIDDIKDMCDDAYTHWACFYDGVDSDGGVFRVNLTTDGGWSESALSEMAGAAGLHWFNFIGCDFPELDHIVVTVNDFDHTVYRPDRLDSSCS